MITNYSDKPYNNVSRTPYDIPGLNPEDDGSQEIDHQNYFCDLCLELCSEKQRLRPDPFCTSVCAVTPTLESWFSDIKTRVGDTFESLFCLKKSQVINNDKRRLDVLNDLINGDILLTNEKIKADLSDFVTKMIADIDYTSELKALLDSTQKDQLRKLTYLFRTMLKPFQNETLPLLDAKIAAISHCLNAQSEQKPFPEENKLTAREYGLLYNSESILNLIRILEKNQITYPHMEELSSIWSQLNTHYDSPAIKQLRQITESSLKEGDILLVDRLVRQELSDARFNFVDVIRHLVGGKLAHIAIYVKNPTGYSLSHVNNETFRHSFKVIHDPLYYQFFPSLKLDITPLIPEEVTESDKMTLNKYFCDCFTAFAKIEHPDIPLAQLSAYAKVLFCGHEGLLKTKNDDPKFETTEGELCSSYVAKVFLHALKSVNKKLCQLGYTKSIPYPFSDYEILERIDILRLLFHWDKFQIYSWNPVHPLIEKFLKIDKNIKAT